MPAISVIVPVYQAEAYLADCVESILAQTFQDFEVILVEDGSPDNSGKLCDAYAAQYDVLSVIHQENQGQAAARNHAMESAKGEWICFVDSDDLIHPQMLELLYNAAVNSDAPIAMCEMLEAVELPEDFPEHRNAEFRKDTLDDDFLSASLDGEDYPGWVACGKLIRRDLIEAYPFREGRVYEDNEAVCRWICQANRLIRTREKLYFYRGNPDSTTKASFRLKRLDYLWALESIIDHYTGLGYEKTRQHFLQRYIDAAISCCYGARCLLNRPDVVKQIDKQTRAFLRRHGVKLEKEQFEALLDAAHPKLVKLYWPVSGAMRTLRQQGVSGVIQKLRKKGSKP